MTDSRNRALSFAMARTTRKLASEVGFCLVDSNADAIARSKVDCAVQDMEEVRKAIVRLYRGRETYTLGCMEKQKLRRLASDCALIAASIDEILDIQETSAPYPLAAE